MANLSLIVLTATSCLMSTLNASAANREAAVGRNTFELTCAACHLGGMGGAPAIIDKENWRIRLQQGEAVLTQHALEGFRAMPARGGNASLTDAEIVAAVKYMLARVRR
jgi:cytochrome c5